MYPNSNFTPYSVNGYYQPNAPVTNNTILKVTGFEGAKAYPMMPNQTAALFDANDNVFWLKSTDAAGFASYKAYRYTEEVANETPMVQSQNDVSREEFDRLKAVVDKLVNGGE